MIKKTIQYEDLDGNPTQEDYYFHLSKAEIIELEMSKDGGWTKFVQSIVDAKDGATIVSLLKKIILTAYGKRSEDGKSFIKSEDDRRAFEMSEAYSELFVELSMNADKAAEFMNGIVPKQVQLDAETIKSEVRRIESEMTKDDISSEAEVDISPEPEVENSEDDISSKPEIEKAKMTKSQLDFLAQTLSKDQIEDIKSKYTIVD